MTVAMSLVRRPALGRARARDPLVILGQYPSSASSKQFR
jgi:hypothetical protein